MNYICEQLGHILLITAELQQVHPLHQEPLTRHEGVKGLLGLLFHTNARPPQHRQGWRG